MSEDPRKSTGVLTKEFISALVENTRVSTEVKCSIDSHIRLTEERLLNHRKTLDDHSDALWGKDGGLTLTVDRLRQSEKLRNWILASFGVAFIALISEVIWRILTHAT